MQILLSSYYWNLEKRDDRMLGVAGETNEDTAEDDDGVGARTTTAWTKKTTGAHP